MKNPYSAKKLSRIDTQSSFYHTSSFSKKKKEMLPKQKKLDVNYKCNGAKIYKI